MARRQDDGGCRRTPDPRGAPVADHHGDHLLHRGRLGGRGPALGGAPHSRRRTAGALRPRPRRLVRADQRRRARRRDRDHVAADPAFRARRQRRPGAGTHVPDCARLGRGDRLRPGDRFRARADGVHGGPPRAPDHGAALPDLAEPQHRGLERARDGHVDGESGGSRRRGRAAGRASAWSGRLSRCARLWSSPASCSRRPSRSMPEPFATAAGSRSWRSSRRPCRLRPSWRRRGLGRFCASGALCIFRRRGEKAWRRWSPERGRRPARRRGARCSSRSKDEGVAVRPAVVHGPRGASEELRDHP